MLDSLYELLTKKKEQENEEETRKSFSFIQWKVEENVFVCNTGNIFPKGINREWEAKERKTGS